MEKHVRFVNQGEALLGVLCTPDNLDRKRDAGLLFLHGWAGYRIGPHQMFTKMARRACMMGFASLAFDFRGRGDSEGDARSASLSTMISDTRRAARVLIEQGGVKKIALVGVCSGGEVALGAGATIPEVDAMVLWSVPQIAADRSRADRAKRMAIWKAYGSKLFRRETWVKLFTGALNFEMIRKALIRGGKGEGEDSTEEDREIDWHRRFIEFRGDIYYIYGTNDPTTADCIAHYKELSRQAGRLFHCHTIQGANHSFYSLKWEAEVLDTSLAWLDARYPQPSPKEIQPATGSLPTGAPA
ncbi:MAG: alpha/beta hydrolase [Candidatus Zipacnadales bacterium]